MSHLRRWWDNLPWRTKDSLINAGVSLFAIGLFGALVAWLVVGTYYASHGDRGEQCYEDLTCEDNLVCVPCRQGCTVNYTCLPPGHP